MLTTLLLWTSPSPALAVDSVALAASVQTSRIEADLRALTGHDPVDTPGGPVRLVSRSVHHPHVDLAGAWLVDALGAITGLQVRTESFSADGEDGLFNVVAELPGAEPSRAPVVLGAHYDSTAALDPEPWDAAIDPAPGADDDASGVAAILEAARLLAGVPGGFSRTVRFVAFSAEEVGLVGSFHHVDGLAQAGEGVALALILDPVGYDPGGGGILWFSYDAAWQDRAGAFEDAAVGLAPALQVLGVDHETFGGDARSDHYPFWQAGLPALHLGTFPQPPSYHTRGDDLDVVDVDFVGAVAGLVAGHAAALAEEPGPAEEPRLLGCRQGPGPGPGLGPTWVLLAMLVLSGRLSPRSARSRSHR